MRKLQTLLIWLAIVGTPPAGGLLLHTLVNAGTSIPHSAPGGVAPESDAHRVRFVEVTPDVELEVLDWGGEGESIVLLAGLGETARTFDSFAPLLAERFRVYGVTRRGFGRSSKPPGQPDFETLAADVMTVVSTLGIDRPFVAGHSIAGEELYVIGSHHAHQVRGLIFLDAAFNRLTDATEQKGNPPLPRPPPPEASDLVSLAALEAYLVRQRLPAWPEAELRERLRIARDGSVGWPPRPAPPWVMRGWSAMMQDVAERHAPPRPRVTSIALYAVPGSAADLMRPWYDADRGTAARVEAEYALAHRRAARHAAWFKKLTGGTAVAVAGEHHLHLTAAATVRDIILEFAAGPR